MSRRKKSKSGKRKTASAANPLSSHEIAVAIQATLGESMALPVDEQDAFAAAVSTDHGKILRYRRDAIEPVEGKKVPWYPLAVHPDESSLRGDRPSRSPDYAACDFYLQDAGSLLALAVAQAGGEALAGKIVCDLCASPGGKASALVEAVGADGFVVANEPIASRVAPLSYNLARTGSARHVITACDPEDLGGELPGMFDLVMVDAPCSGQTLLARNRQSIGSLNAGQIETNAKRQKRILESAIRLLRPGGRLVYSTCTFATAENENQVNWLVNERGLLAEEVDGLSDYQSAPGSYRLWPHRHSCAGSFAACVRTPMSDLTSSEARIGEMESIQLQVATPQQLTGICEQLPMFEQSTASRDLRIDDWLLQEIAAGSPSPLLRLRPGGAVERTLKWPEIAHRSSTTWKPSHALALRRGADRLDLPVWEVDQATARQYLTGQTIPIAHRGWMIVTHRGRGLGWVKADGRIGKNHLPPFARF